MPLAICLREIGRRFLGARRPLRRGRMLRLESLEDRFVPSIVFNNATTATISDGGGPVIDQVHVELIFWGSGWDTGQGPSLRAQTEAAVDSITTGPYLSYMSQYRADIGNGFRIGSVTIASSSPPSVFSDANVRNMLITNIGFQALPVPNGDPNLLYMVIPQSGSTAGSTGAEHSYMSLGGLRAHYGWTTNRGDLDHITYYYAHELAEAVSDPEGTAIQANPRNANSWNEICDGEAQSYAYRLNGYMVNSWFSQADHGYVVPTGQVQNFYVSNRNSRVLTVNGGQLPGTNDTITIDQQNGSYIVNLNGEVAQFDAVDFRSGGPGLNSIMVNTGDGDVTVNVEGTIADHPVTINLGSGSDSVFLSPAAQNLTNLAGAVTVNGGSGVDSVFLCDQSNPSGRTFTITGAQILPSGAAAVTYHTVSSLVLLGGSGGNTFNVQSTSAALMVEGGGADTLVGPSAASIWNLFGIDAGWLSGPSIAGAVGFSSVQNLTAGGAGNAFIFSDGATLSGNLEGGGGSLDYSAYSSSVIVDLQIGFATGVGGGVANIQNVNGGNGGGAGDYNILVGAGGNTLTGGNGRRNLLIAGSSASTLTAGDDEDILIGGTTAYDMDVASLMALMDYWSGTSDDYATRVGNLLAGNGVPLLDPSTVRSNGGGNTLSGGPGLNLYFGNNADSTDFDPSSGAVFIPV